MNYFVYDHDQGASEESKPGKYQKVRRKGRRSKKRKRDGLGLKLLSVLLSILMICVLGLIWTMEPADPEEGEEGRGDIVIDFEQIKDKFPTFDIDIDPFPGVAEGDDTPNKAKYSISTSSEYATQAGAAILEAGGNAVDAAIAISYNLAVSEPYASGLGGGGCMVVYDPETEKFTFYNYGAEAPKSGGSWLVLVPGFVSGMEMIRQDFATMSYEQLLQSALECCDGVEINENGAMRIQRAESSLSKNSPFYGENGFLKEGDVLIQPELKQTLQQLIEEGPDSFYTGTIAQDIADATSLTLEDLAAYETTKTDAVVGTFGEYTVGAAGAPFSGATLIQMLKMAEMLELPDPDDDNVGFLSKLCKISQTAQYDRINHIYDYRFSHTPVDQNASVTNSYIADLLGLDVSNFVEEEECEDTTGFTVIDQNGMVVACTNTLSSFFGSKIFVDGFYMNNTGYLFGSGVNAYAAGKRPRTHISPAILISDDEILAVASPGGNCITRVLANVVLDVCRFGEDYQTAIDKQRVIFLHGNVLYYESGYDTPLMVKVSGCGYSAIAYSYHSFFGSVSLSGYNDKLGFFAGEDVRRCGSSLASNG